ncbi:aldo/keto reductase [Streptomyces sp. BE133]|uniref:aldo/keto reductase n=1 Tax=Streptomyces sp. BE133 TaxID=3002523 RepID=UPI003FA736A3
MRVSELCLGTMTFARAGDEVAAHRILDTFTEAGGTFIDTADMYDRGGSEEVLGRRLKGRNRDDLVIATKVWGPLDGGWLSGKYRRGVTDAPADSRAARNRANRGDDWRRRDNKETWQVVDAVLAVAEEAGRIPAQVALRRLLGRPGVTAPIIGARTIEQLTDGLGAVGRELTADRTVRPDAASARPLPYPYDILERLSDRDR